MKGFPANVSTPIKSVVVALALSTLVVATAAAEPGPGWQQAQAPRAQTPQQQGVNAPKLDPAAVAALRRMGQHLLSLKSFEIQAAIEMEYVLENDQKIQIGGSSHYRVRRPDRLRVDLHTDVVDRIFQYDGKQLVVTAPKEKYFARLDAKPTVRETLAWAAETFGIEVPLADLFDWGTPEASDSDLREGFLVGKAHIGGLECDHWAFRSEDVDWEIWIRTGDKPLPLKLSIVTTGDPARPRYDALLTWSEAMEFPDEIFLSAPVPDAKRIEFLPTAPAPGRPK